MVAVFWRTAHVVLGLDEGAVRYWLYFGYSSVTSALVYLVVLSLLQRHSLSGIVPAVFQGVYLFAYGVNAGFMLHTGRLFNPSYLGRFRGASLEPFLTPAVWLILAAYCIALGGGLQLLRCRSLRVRSLFLPVTLLVLLVPLRYSARFHFHPLTVLAEKSSIPKQGVWRADQVASLNYISASPLVAAIEYGLWREEIPRRWPVAELGSYARTLRAHDLPLGQRDYPRLVVKPFRRIVVFGTESLSLDFLAPYNGSLPVELTPFYASEASQRGMFTNYWSGAVLTHPAILVTYLSHPNPLAFEAGAAEWSLPCLLRKEGYRTVFLRSASEKFNAEDRLWRRLGFDEIVGAETHYKNPEYRSYIEGWGLMDRLLYRRLGELMRTASHEKLFIHVAGTDTHSPSGRSYYGDLRYPSAPLWLETVSHRPAKDWLRAVFRHDYDLGQAVDELRRSDLLGEDVLLVISADHGFPRSSMVRGIPGYPGQELSRLPLLLLSGQRLPAAERGGLHSQLDLAPTILHLMGIPVPVGYWGESLFLRAKRNPAVAMLGRQLIIRHAGPTGSSVLDVRTNAAGPGLVRLVRTVVVPCGCR
jgi:hypothetical protein